MEANRSCPSLLKRSRHSFFKEQQGCFALFALFKRGTRVKERRANSQPWKKSRGALPLILECRHKQTKSLEFQMQNTNYTLNSGHYCIYNWPLLCNLHTVVTTAYHSTFSVTTVHIATQYSATINFISAAQNYTQPYILSYIQDKYDLIYFLLAFYIYIYIYSAFV